MEFTEPDDVRELTDGMALNLAGVEFIVNHAPGHTEGSVTFRLPFEETGSAAAVNPITAQGKSKTGPPSGDLEADVLFSGDLLFAGSIGRTDLPGGDYRTILDSLARVCLTLPDQTLVLSGHGPQTTIGAERRDNPFLTGLRPAAGPGRGM